MPETDCTSCAFPFGLLFLLSAMVLSVHLPVPCQFPLDLACLFFAVRALQRFVRAAPEPLRVTGVGDLPVDQDNQRGEEQAPAVEVLDEQHGREHHKMSPVIDPAVDAAFIFHNKGLEWAEEQNADVVTQEIKYCEHQQIAGLDHPGEIQQSEYGVEGHPDKDYLPGTDILLLYELQQLVVAVPGDGLVFGLAHFAQGHGQAVVREQMKDH